MITKTDVPNMAIIAIAQICTSNGIGHCMGLGLCVYIYIRMFVYLCTYVSLFV